METKEYFEKELQDFYQNCKGRNLRKYCNDEGVDYKWLVEYKRTYGCSPGHGSRKIRLFESRLHRAGCD